MPLPDVHRIETYWSHTPPIRDMIAAFMGVKDGGQAQASAESAIAEEDALPEFEE